MSSIERYIRKMRNNPIGWRIESLEAVARSLGISIRKSGGSHVVFEHEASEILVSVPARRPIKPVYVRQFIQLIDDIER